MHSANSRCELGSSNVGEHFSLARILDPVPCTAFGTILEVLSKVPVAIATPFLVPRLRANHDLQYHPVQVSNVVSKLTKYLPDVARRCHELVKRLLVSNVCKLPLRMLAPWY